MDDFFGLAVAFGVTTGEGDHGCHEAIAGVGGATSSANRATMGINKATTDAMQV